MENISQKPVIVIATHGTVSSAGLQDLENVDRLVTERYPDNEVRWALAFGGVREKFISSGQTTLFERQVPMMSLAEVYADLRKEGKRNVAVQFLFVLPGSDGDYNLMVDADDLNVEYGYALLGHPDNITRIADALVPRFGDEDTVTIICSDGNKMAPALNYPLIQMDQYLRKLHPHIFLTTRLGLPGKEAVVAEVRKLGLPKVKFIPLYFVAGEHIINGIMGDDPTTLKSQLGLEASNEFGMGKNPTLMSIWMESIDWTLAKFPR